MCYKTFIFIGVMMISCDLKEDIENLKLGVVKMEEAFKEGDGIRYGELGKEYGPIAFRVYKELDKESKGVDFFDGNPVLLDPCTVQNRTKEMIFQGEEPEIYSEEFWLHSDMAKSLCDYIDMKNNTLVAGCIDG